MLATQEQMVAFLLGSASRIRVWCRILSFKRVFIFFQNYRMPFISSAEGALGYGRSQNSDLNTLLAVSQTYVNTTSGSSVSTDGSCICTDSQNNVYITGVSTNTSSTTLLNMNRSSSLKSLPGYKTIYIIKFNASGNIVWANCISDSALSYTNPSGVSVDSLGNIYITGGYSTTTTTTPVFLMDVAGNSQTINPNSISLSFTPTTTTYYSYIIKYNSSGITQWATYNIFGRAYASSKIDSANNIYIATNLINSTSIRRMKIASTNSTPQVDSTITPIPANTNATPARSAFVIMKYSSNGVPQWATYFNSSASSSVLGSIEIDSNNNIYLAGPYSQSTTAYALMDVSGNTQAASLVTLPIYTGTNANQFIIKYNSSGKARFATYLQINGTTGYGSRITSLYCIGTNLYCGGNNATVGTITLYDASGNTQSISTKTLAGLSASTNINANLSFLIKYDISIDTKCLTQWSTYIGTPEAQYSERQQINSITVDSSGNVYVAGTATSDSRITVRTYLRNASGNGQSISNVSFPYLGANILNNFIAKYTTDGSALNFTYFTFGSLLRIYITTDSLDNKYIYFNTSVSQSGTLLDGYGTSQRASSSVTYNAVAGNCSLLKYY